MSSIFHDYSPKRCHQLRDRPKSTAFKDSGRFDNTRRVENTFEIHFSRSRYCTSRSFGRVRVNGDADLSPAFCIGRAGSFGPGSVLNSVTPEQKVRGYVVAGGQRDSNTGRRCSYN